MTIDRDKLRRLASHAMPGPWGIDPVDHDIVQNCEDGRCAVVGYADDESADFIAAANPAAVLALLDALDQAERESAYRIDAETRADKERDEARAEVERLRALLARILKYAREDRARTPGATRLARALDEADAALAGKDGAR